MRVSITRKGKPMKTIVAPASRLLTHTFTSQNRADSNPAIRKHASLIRNSSEVRAESQFLKRMARASVLWNIGVRFCLMEHSLFGVDLARNLG